MADPIASDARSDILARVRRALPRVRPARPAELDQPSPGAPRDLDTPAQRLERFVEVLEGVGGHVQVVRDEAAAASALAALLVEWNARELALSDSALVRRLADTLPDVLQRFDGWSDRARLFTCDVGLTGCQAGVAETGTLVLDSARERHRLVSLVPPVHVAVLRRADILPGLGDALALIGRAHPAAPAGAVTLITGPSRTADIELELVVGVHGPRVLHVMVLEESPA